MNKLFCLALIAAFAFVVGCKKQEDATTPAAGATNAAPAAK